MEEQYILIGTIGDEIRELWFTVEHPDIDIEERVVMIQANVNKDLLPEKQFVPKRLDKVMKFFDLNFLANP